MDLINCIKENKKSLFFFVSFFWFLMSTFGQEVTIDAGYDDFIVSGENLEISGTYDNVDFNLNPYVTLEYLRDDGTSTGQIITIVAAEGSSLFTTFGNQWSLVFNDAGFPESLEVSGIFRLFVSVTEKVDLIGDPGLDKISAGGNITIDRIGPQLEPSFEDIAFNITTPTISGTYSYDISNGEHSDSVVIKILNESGVVLDEVLQTNTALTLPNGDSDAETWTLDFQQLSDNGDLDLDFGERYKIAIVTYDTSHISHPVNVGVSAGDRTNITADTALLLIGMVPTLSTPTPSNLIIDPSPEIQGRVTVNEGDFALDSMVVELTSRVAGSTFTFTYPNPDQDRFSFADVDSFSLDLSDTIILELALDTFDVDIKTYDILDNEKINQDQYFIIEFPDEDGDGISNFIECGNTVVDLETDLGLQICGNIDTDKDGTPNYLDLDSDNDSIPDEVEVFGTIAEYNLGNLVADSLSHLLDSDNDGTPNYLDEDSDGDFVPDYFESGQYYNSTLNFTHNNTTFLDADGDGVYNHIETDADDDGLSDQIEAITLADPEDLDEDSIQNFLDLDSDGDYLSDATETDSNFDGDEYPDYRDIDSDNDGINDSTEVKEFMNTVLSFPASILDSDGDGASNHLDLNSDDDHDQILDTFELADDPDDDNIPSFLDDDSDDDYLLDSMEFDGDYDGLVLFTIAGDEPNDFDQDGTYDFKDDDSDGDNILDSVEIKGNNTTYTYPPDNYGVAGDNDVFPNHLDIDADGDYVPDSVELAEDTPLDTDLDLNYLDLDSDGDDLSDSLETGLFYISGSVGYNIDVFQDADNDGIINSLEEDADDDGYADAFEYDFSDDDDSTFTRNGATFVNEPDENDGDGIYDFLDNTFNTKYTSPRGADAEIEIVSTEADWDSDGHSDTDEFTGFGNGTKPVDTDGDGYYDFADLDSDDDGFSDTEEECESPGTVFCDVVTAAPQDTPGDDRTAITPESEGLVVNSNLNAKLTVFNRWGQIVFEQDPYPSTTVTEINYWKGTSQNGALLPVGTYFYTLEYEGKLESSYVYIIR